MMNFYAVLDREGSSSGIKVGTEAENGLLLSDAAKLVAGTFQLWRKASLQRIHMSGRVGKRGKKRCHWNLQEVIIRKYWVNLQSQIFGCVWVLWVQVRLILIVLLSDFTALSSSLKYIKHDLLLHIHNNSKLFLTNFIINHLQYFK